MLGMKRPQSFSKGLDDIPTEKRSRLGSEEASHQEKKVLCDRFCWRCHKEGTLLECRVCPRSFHPRCDTQGATQDSQWTCFECRRIMAAEDIDTRSPAMALLSVEQLRTLLKYALMRLKQNALIVFHNPVSVEEYPKYPEYIVHPMDLSQLEKNVRNRVYGSTEAFLADVKWILHNSIIFNGDGHRLTAAAKSVVNAAKQEMKEIEICPDCYLHAHTLKENWFIEPCRRSHVLVWAKMKGYPYWPGKALRAVNGNIDVRFFGAHDRAQVPQQLCFLLSYDLPQPLKSKKKAKLYVALEELEQHIQRLRAKLGGFEYAPPRTQLDLDRLYLQPISKVSTGRRHSDAEMSSQPKGRTVTIVTSSWMRRLQAEGHVKPPIKEKKEKPPSTTTAIPPVVLAVENFKPAPVGRMQGPQKSSSPIKPLMIKSEPKTKSSANPPTGVFEISDRSLNIPKQLDPSSASVNLSLNVTEPADMEKHREIQSTLDKLQERILETFHDESHEEESSPEAEEPMEMEKPVEREKPLSMPTLLTEDTVSNQTVESLDDSSPYDVSASDMVEDCEASLNTEEWMKAKSSCAFSQRLGQTIESCKAKLGIREIEDDAAAVKTSESDEDSSDDESADSECDKMAETENGSHQSEKDSTDKQLSESEDILDTDPQPPKSLQDLHLTETVATNSVDTQENSDGSVNETISEEMDQDQIAEETDRVTDIGEPDKGDEMQEDSSGIQPVVSEEQEVDNQVQNAVECSEETLPNGIDHLDSTSLETGMTKDSTETPVSRNSSERRTTPEPDLMALPLTDNSTESDIANYAHKLIDFMKELGRDGGSNPQATIRSLELELEKQRWHHQQELVEIKHNTDLVLLEVRASLEIDKERALSELRRKYYIEKNKAVEELKKKFNTERQQFEKAKAMEIEEIKKKQWCANCQKEAIYYCCWNTSYCDYPCQQAHWLKHQESCGQLQNNSLMENPQNKNSLTITKTSVTANPPQTGKPPAVQVQYVPNQSSCYQIMTPNVNMNQSSVTRAPQARNVVTIQAVSRNVTNSTSTPPVTKLLPKPQ